MMTIPQPDQSSTIRRPRVLIVSLILFVLATVLWMPIIGSAGPQMSLATLVLILHLVFGIRATAGRRTARIVATVCCVLLCVLLAPFAWLGFSEQSTNVYGPEYAVMDIIAVLSSGSAIVLLFLPRSNAYAREVTAWREAQKTDRAASD